MAGQQTIQKKEIFQFSGNLDLKSFVIKAHESKNPDKFIHDTKQLANQILNLANEYYSMRQRVRLKYVLKQLERPECKAVLMELLGISNTASFNAIANDLIEQGMIRSIGKEIQQARIVSEIYTKTKFRPRTSSYYTNVKRNDFEDEFYFFIDEELNLGIEEHCKAFEFLIKQAEQIEVNKNLTKLDKCIIALKEWGRNHVEQHEIRKYLCYELDLLPKSDKQVKEYFSILIERGVLRKLRGYERTFEIIRGDIIGCTG